LKFDSNEKTVKSRRIVVESSAPRAEKRGKSIGAGIVKIGKELSEI